LRTGILQVSQRIFSPGFLNADGDAYGRPVGVAIDKSGALLVADDVGNTVWRVTLNTKQ